MDITLFSVPRVITYEQIRRSCQGGGCVTVARQPDHLVGCCKHTSMMQFRSGDYPSRAARNLDRSRNSAYITVGG